MSAGIGGINVDGAAAGAAGGGGITNIRVSAGTTSNLLSAITFADTTGVSFGLNASTITATVGTVQAASGLTFSTATAGTTVRPIEMSNWRNYSGMISVAGAGLSQGSGLVQPFHLQNPVAFSNIAIFGSVQLSTTNNTSSAYYDVSASAVLYTRNVSTLSSITSFNNTFTMSWQSNNQAATMQSGYMAFALTGAATTLTQGEYYVAFHVSRTFTATNTSTATTSFGDNFNPVIAFSLPSANTAPIIRPFGQATNQTLAIVPGLGQISSGGTRVSIAFSDMTASGTAASIAAVAFELRNATWWG